MSQYVVTGSATADGGPIYLSPTGTWTRRVEEAERLEETRARERASEAAARAQAIVCDPYVIPVTTDGDAVQPTTLKERIRANGPTVTFGVHA
jgi:hypothetical protein